MYLNSRARWEFTITAVVAVIGSCIVLYALLYARTTVRDNLRRDDITNLKRALEFYYNVHEHYGTPYAHGIHCTRSDDPVSWLFGNESPLLKELHFDAIPHDVREQHGHVYQFCATEVSNERILGYFLEAQLEIPQPDVRAFDEDERRKFHYRILHDKERVLYRVCGGTDLQCEPDK